MTTKDNDVVNVLFNIRLSYCLQNKKSTLWRGFFIDNRMTQVFSM